MPTSSADPAKLAQYATDGLALVADLQAKAGALVAAAKVLSRSDSDHVPRLGEGPELLDDLAGDWRHLDEFAGDVADGFFAFLGVGPYPNPVATLSDSRLARLGQIGYADRDQAIADAAAAARDLAELRRRLGDREISAEEVNDLVGRIARGQHDPAFAVAFSEQVGVEGYVEAMAVIRSAYMGDVPPEGLDAVQVLATTLTTALDTRPGIPAEDRHDADNAGLATDQRLDRGFVDDLVDMEFERGSPFDFGPSEQDLALLLSLTAPPAGVAVAVANARLTPNLGNTAPWEMTAHGKQWGDHGDIVTNYATMLAGSEDASVRWLYSSPEGDTRNLELVLQRNGDCDADGGEALATVVENGLTHPDRVDSRQQLLEDAVATIGEQGEIRNPHLNEALAAGVEHNMDVIDRIVNDSWLDPQEIDDPYAEPPPGVANTHVFLREIMRDEQAAVTVWSGVDEHLLEQLAELPERSLDPSDDRTDALRNIGTLHGVVVAAEGNVAEGSLEDQIARQEARADSVNFLIGLVPYAEGAYGTVNDLADVAGVSVGELGYGSNFDDLDEAQQTSLIGSGINTEIMLAIAHDPERALTTPISQMSRHEQLEYHQWATSPGIYDLADHDSLTAATWRVVHAFLGDT